MAVSLRRGLGGAAVVLMLAVSACGASDGPVRTVTAFYEAVKNGNGPLACGLLAPATREELESSEESPCSEALTDLSLPAVDGTATAQVYGRNAQVRLGGETLFLTENGSTWLITAAGCTPRGERPYDCTIKGN